MLHIFIPYFIRVYRPLITRLFASALFVLIFYIAGLLPASAHPLNNGYSNLKIEGQSIAYDLFIPENSLLRFDQNRNGLLEQSELEGQQASIESYLTQGVRIASGGKQLESALEGLERNDQDAVPGIMFHLRYTAPGAIDSFTLDYELLFDDVDPAHVNFLLVEADDDADQAVLSTDSRSYYFEALHPHVGAALWQYFKLGVHHILSGWDHLLFVLSLLLVAARTADIVKIVTSFTVAHSITLFLAATGRVSVDPRWVESLIALTIAYVAAENCFVQQTGKRWMLTFFFGLIHGLGFAGALAETGLPQTNMVATLLSFNVGVEAGQLAVVLAVLPLLLRLRKLSRYRQGMIAASAVIGLVAVALFATRLWGS